MMLRVATLSAVLLASVAPTVVPAVAQSHGNSFADTTTQQTAPYSGQVVEDIVARINDQVISRSDYDRAEQELEQEARQQNWNQQQLMEQRRDLLRSLIDRQLLLSKGKELGINGETQVIRRLDEIRKQNHLASMEDLQKAAEQQGVSFEDFKEQIREQVITQQVIGQEVGSHIIVSPTEMKEYYQSHKQDFERPESERLSEILIPTPNPDDATQVADAQKKADGIEQRLRSGADFATVAKADSGGTTASEGGDLGTYKRGQLAKVLEDATFDLKAGDITQPIRTKQGWLILKVTEHQNAGLAPYEEVQNQIQEALGYQKMEPALRAYLEQLRNESYVEVRSPYSDSGATSNEIKFVQSAYTAPQPKHKKQVTRARFREKAPARGKAATTETTAGGVPAGVPSLDKINSQKSSGKPVNVATEKPGRKEKIRFGQAPRETLPTAETRHVDAGADTTQVANNAVPDNANNAAATALMTNAQGNLVNTSQEDEKKSKTRLSDRPKEVKARRAAEKKAKHQKFTAPVQTVDQTEAQKQQEAALGLNGDTTHIKKAEPAKSGPKRRYSDKEKNPELTTPEQTSGANANSQTQVQPAGPMSNNKVPNAGQTSPATSGGSQSGAANQGTGTSTPQ
jgi:peptidyl-prolyl cis-trans isomerase SurA